MKQHRVKLLAEIKRHAVLLQLLLDPQALTRDWLQSRDEMCEPGRDYICI
jgi:hypothetical protein